MDEAGMLNADGAEVAEIHESENEEMPVLDVHPAHHAANSWKEFIVHIATIVLGLLIAVGLEQTVEYVQHRREVAETRKALEVERKINVNLFVAEAEEFRRYVPILKKNLAILAYLREHPHAPASQWPGEFNLFNTTYTYVDSAWHNAVENHVVAYMPALEVENDTVLYFRLHQLTDAQQSAADKIQEWQQLRMYAPDASTWSPAQIDHQIELMSSILKDYRSQAIGQANFANRHHDFQGSLTTADANSIVPFLGSASPETRAIRDRLQRANAAVQAAAGESAEAEPK
jgi:hypothetical protein